MLTKRENLIEVMRGGTPDRFVNQYEAFSLIMGVPVSPYKRTPYGGEISRDGWGVSKIWPEGTPGAFPLHDKEHLVCPDITHWQDYVKAPQTHYPDGAWEGVMRQEAGVDRNEKFALVFLNSGLFETCHNLLGLEECLVSFYEEPECMHELIDYIKQYQLEAAKEICGYLKPDGIFLHDDWGTQLSTFISAEMFEEFFVPAYKEIYGYYKSRGAGLVVHHSDSYGATLVPYMIDMGINIWQGVLSTNNIPELIQKYGPKITFMGGVDDGKVDVPDWTPQLVEDEVQKACMENGGLYYIPSLCQGLPFSIYPGVHDAVTGCIDKMSKQMFRIDGAWKKGDCSQ